MVLCALLLDQFVHRSHRNIAVDVVRVAAAAVLLEPLLR
jgi:hypothetical protein